MRRVALITAAAGFFAAENVAAVRWLAEHGTLAGGLAHAWQALTADGLVMLVWADMGVFTVAALAWLVADSGRRGLPAWHRAAWLAATVALGCPAFLIYLAGRPAPAGSAGAGRPA